MNTITQNCNSILTHHTHLQRKLSALLRPGIDSAHLKQQTANLPFTTPASVHELYTWRDGTQTGKAPFCDMWIFPGYYFLSIADAVERFSSLQKHPQITRPNLLPLLSSSASDYIGIECQGNSMADGAIYEYVEGLSLELKFSSLSKMLETVEAAFADGIFFVSENSQLDMDDERFENLSRKIDPDLPQ